MKADVTIVILLAFIPAVALVARETPHSHSRRNLGDSAWPRLQDDMAAMHAAMAAVEPSDNDDVSFVSLMLPTDF